MQRLQQPLASVVRLTSFSKFLKRLREDALILSGKLFHKREVISYKICANTLI